MMSSRRRRRRRTATRNRDDISALNTYEHSFKSYSVCCDHLGTLGLVCCWVVLACFSHSGFFLLAITSRFLDAFGCPSDERLKYCIYCYAVLSFKK
jgi:hypothetical protein